MPLYDYECTQCTYIQEEFRPYEQREVVCNECGSVSKRIVSGSRIDVFKPFHSEELGDDIPYIESKQQLAQECEKRGLYSRYLLESYNSQRPRREL